MREFVRRSVPSFPVLGQTEDIVDGPEDGGIKGGVAGRSKFGEALTVKIDEREGGGSTV